MRIKDGTRDADVKKRTNYSKLRLRRDSEKKFYGAWGRRQGAEIRKSSMASQQYDDSRVFPNFNVFLIDGSSLLACFIRVIKKDFPESLKDL